MLYNEEIVSQTTKELMVPGSEEVLQVGTQVAKEIFHLKYFL